jgi:hypothetical protein
LGAAAFGETSGHELHLINLQVRRRSESMTAVVVVVAASVCAAAVVAWFVLGRGYPEGVTRRGAATTSEVVYGGADRPAGPDAEPMDPDALGGDHRPPR